MDLTIGLIMNLPFSVDLDSVRGAVSLITLLRGAEKDVKVNSLKSHSIA